MADIELVIKIPEGLKNDFESEQWTALSCMEMKNALEKATPLPKGHGEIIDTKDLYEYLNKERDDNFVLKVDAIVGKVKPIIETDKER